MSVFENVKFWNELRWLTTNGYLPFTVDGRETGIRVTSNGKDNRDNPVLRFEVTGVFTYVVSFHENEDGTMKFIIAFGWLHEGAVHEDAEHYLTMLRLQATQ